MKCGLNVEIHTREVLQNTNLGGPYTPVAQKKLAIILNRLE